METQKAALFLLDSNLACSSNHTYTYKPWIAPTFDKKENVDTFFFLPTTTWKRRVSRKTKCS